MILVLSGGGNEFSKFGFAQPLAQLTWQLSFGAVALDNVTILEIW